MGPNGCARARVARGRREAGMAKDGQKSRAGWWIAGLALAVGAAGTVFWLRGHRDAAPPEATALTNPDEWPSWGRTEGEQHYSPLDQIEVDTVARLGLAWHYDL